MQYEPPVFSQNPQFAGVLYPQFRRTIPQAHMAQFPGYNSSVMSVPSQGLLPTPQTFFTPGFPCYDTSQSSQHTQHAAVQSPSPPNWYFDSGANNHVTNDLSQLTLQQPCYGSAGVMVGNGNSLPICNSGKGLLTTPTSQFTLSNVLHVPSMTQNLLSVFHFAKDNHCKLTFDDSGFVIQDKTTNKVLHQGPCHQGLYPLHPCSDSAPSQVLLSTRSSALEWHNKLGHPSLPLFTHLVQQYALPVSKPYSVNCISCNVSKSHKLAFPLSINKTTAPFELLHMDVWGPAPVPSVRGFKYYLVILDDYSRYIWLFPLHYKSDVKSTLDHFTSYVHTQFNVVIKTFRSDNGGEFINQYLAHLFLHLGIIHQTSCPNTPEQNGRAERQHRHLIETTLTLLHHAHLPLKFWLEALTTSVYLINRLPHSAVQFQIPYKLLFHNDPDYLSFKPFGCLCFPWLKPYAKNKFSPKSASCIFLGYCDTTKGYRCMDLESHKVYVSRHVKLVDSVFPFTSAQTFSSSSSCFSLPISALIDITLAVTDSLTTYIPAIPFHESFPPNSHSFSPSSSTSPSSSSAPSCIVSPPLVPMSSSASPSSAVCSSPVVVPTTSAHPMRTRSQHGIYKPKVPLSLTAVSTFPAHTEPKSFSEAIKITVWQNAMHEEYSALLKQGTWELVQPPSHVNIIGCHWIYKLKRHSDGSIARYKARLVARGNQQSEGLDFTETFSPVVKQPTLRVVLSLAVHNHWSIRQLDVSNAFLHGPLEEEVYMRQPQGYVDPQRPSHVCKLKKALYGLRQAPRAWFALFSKFLVTLGFANSMADTSLFVYHKDTVLVYVLIYVDDIIVTGNNSIFISELLVALKGQFAIKDLGELHYFLGIEVLRNNNSLYLYQTTYALELLNKAGMLDCQPCLSPASTKPPIFFGFC